MAKVEIASMHKSRITFGIQGLSPLIMHKWSEKALKMLRDKGAGKKTKNREVRNPEKEAKDGIHLTAKKDVGIPAGAFKKALINAAHKDIGIEKTLVRKSIFIETDDPGMIMKISADKPILREDPVRIGQGSADLRYRFEFRNWKCQISATIDSELLRPDDVLKLVERAGFGVGLLEMRPEKEGEFGRFEIDPKVKFTQEVLS